MRKLTLPAKRIDAPQLRAELVAAGVPLRPLLPGGIPGDIYLSSDELVVLVEVEPGADQYDAIATQVIQAHVPPADLTLDQIKKRSAKAALRNSEDRALIATRAGLKILYQSLVETRTTLNQIRAQLVAAGLPLTVPALINRTWEQALNAVEQQIDTEVEQVNNVVGVTP